jgi:SAM-dependent methyltransferase
MNPLPLPPLELAARIGGGYEQYELIGKAHRKHIDSLLPADWSFADKCVLDFGCGTGRTLVAYAPEAYEAEFWGCDIHQPSITWASESLSPPFHFFLCSETPPLQQPDGRFDLVVAMSVFTHIADHWSSWLAELHRVMRPGGIAVVSFLGPAMSQPILGRDWDPRIGMTVVDLHKGWEIGGPSVFHSEWWIREHWGRAFEILAFDQFGDGTNQPGHGFVAMRRRDTSIKVAEVEAINPADLREHHAAVANLELLKQQLVRLGEERRRHDGEVAQRERKFAAERQALLERIEDMERELARLRDHGSGGRRLRLWHRTASILRR